MPDPLDPTDAFFSAIGTPFVRTGAVLGALFAGHSMGTQIGNAPTVLSAFFSANWTAAWSAIQWPGWQSVLAWLASYTYALKTPAAWPWLVMILWQIGRARGEGELFFVVLWTVIAQTGISFTMAVESGAVVGMDLGISIGLLAVFIVGFGALMFWWRHTTENAPEVDPEAEPEL